ncbi:hypothetical protein LTR37_018034 [Vermiconidia calcicola]|uniref:Uncharacterized protein n=1 Tax=Vermiconidia calcicola TaxID=1690605 RepID=A0ACC3MJR7_9PEZI|nr:hypothetical protein LTR37_018034 [Vermiconidia calcicola]
MASRTNNILIFGATGTVGKHIARSIVESGDFGRVGIFTSPDSIKTKADAIDGLKDRGVEVITGDITVQQDVEQAFNGFDTVVSCLGRTVLHKQLQMIELADKHHDVKRFFPSEYGTDIEYWPNSAHEPPHQQKLKVRAALRDVKDLEYTYVVTGPYADADGGLFLGAAPVDKEAAGTFDVKRKRAVLLGDGNGKISLTTMRDVGELVVAATKHPEASRNRALKVNSFTATPKEIVAEFEQQTGGQAWDVSYTSLEQLKEMEKEAHANGDPRAGPLTLRRIWTEGGTLYDRRDNELIGMEDKMTSLPGAIKQAVQVQTG